MLYRGIYGYMVMYRWCMVMYGGVWCCIGVYGVV